MPNSHNPLDHDCPSVLLEVVTGSRRRLLRCLCLSVAVFSVLPFSVIGQEVAPFRIGFSSASFSEVNENDARAAVRVWAQALAKERGIPADPQSRTLKGVEEMAAALTNHLIDAVNLTAVEYWQLRRRVALDQCVVGVQGDSIHEEYLLLVHRDSGIERLGDLQGRSLAVLQSPRTALASMWLETLVLNGGFGVLSNFVSRVSFTPKTTKAVLPVFFRQVDACVVTKRGFETMVELNPQTGRQLKTLAISPSFVPFLFSFRADYTAPIRKKIVAEIGKWHTSPAGRQILTIFQIDRLEERPVSCLDPTLALLAAHQRLTQPGLPPEVTAARAVPSSGDSEEEGTR